MKKCIVLAGAMIALANIGEGAHGNGLLTRISEGVITKGQILMKGTGDTQVKACTALTDVGLYVAMDSAANGEIIPCTVLGNLTGTVLVLASGAVAVSDAISPLGTAVANGLTCGRALTAAADGEVFEMAHKVCA